MLLDPAVLDEYTESFREAVDEQRWREAARLARQFSSTRIADILKELSVEEAGPLLQTLPLERAGRVLGQLPPPIAARLLNAMAAEQASHLFPAVPLDRMPEILDECDEAQTERLLLECGAEVRQQIDLLRRYPHGTAGGAMTPNFLAVRHEASIGQALSAVMSAPASVEKSTYVYVLDEGFRPAGVISIKDLYRVRPETPVKEVMTRDVAVIHAEEEGARAARIIRNRRFTMLPVVDEAGAMLGVITFDDAMDLIAEEVANQFAGVGSGTREESFFTPPMGAVRLRLPWMAANVILNLGAVYVIASFENTIAQVAILAAFLPMITDMGGNVGIQSLSVAIRSIALGEVRLMDFWKAARKEALVGLTNGAILGIQFTVIAYLLEGNIYLGVLAGAALAINVLVAGIVGGCLPFLIKRLGKDPAMMTGPVLTTITDITGVSIYLGLCTVFLSQLLAGG